MKILPIIFLLLLVSSACQKQREQAIEDNEPVEKERLQIDPNQLPTGFYYVVDSSNTMRLMEGTEDSFFLNPDPIVSSRDFTSLEMYQGDDGHWGLIISFDAYGKKRWSEATAAYIDKRIAVVFGNRLLSAPTILNQITGGKSSIARRDYSKEDVERIKEKLEFEMEN